MSEYQEKHEVGKNNNKIPFNILSFLYPNEWMIQCILESLCPSVQIFVAIVSAPNGWFNFKFGVGLHIDGTNVVSNYGFSPFRGIIVKIFAIKILAPNSWIYYKFGV